MTHLMKALSIVCAFFCISANSAFATPIEVINSITIEQKISEVFIYLSTAGNWPKWHPATVSVAGVIDRPAIVGDSIQEVIRTPVGNVDVNWTVEVFNAPNSWVIKGQSIIGTFIITYSFSQSINESTLFQRHVIFQTNSELNEAQSKEVHDLLYAQSKIALENVKSLIEKNKLLDWWEKQYEKRDATAEDIERALELFDKCAPNTVAPLIKNLMKIEHAEVWTMYGFMYSLHETRLIVSQKSTTNEIWTLIINKPVSLPTGGPGGTTGLGSVVSCEVRPSSIE